MANSILLTGRITKDLELKQAGQVSKCDFVLAVDREYAKEGQQKTDFINITVFGKTAENLCKYQAKGSKILVLEASNILFELSFLESKNSILLAITLVKVLFSPSFVYWSIFKAPNTNILFPFA